MKSSKKPVAMFLLSALGGSALVATGNFLYFGSAIRPNLIIIPNNNSQTLCDVNGGFPFWLSESGCVFCIRAEAYLESNDFKLKKIESERVRKKLGIRSVPAVVFADGSVVGFSPREFRRAARAQALSCEDKKNG